MIARSFPAPRPGARGPFALGLLVLACLSGAHADAQTSSPRRTMTIAWRTDYASALAESRAKNLPLWVQFTGPWCPHCQRMDRETFTRGEIISLADRTIPVKVQSDVHEDLTERFQITGLPATVIVSPTGAVLGHHEGFEEARAFRTILDQALARAPRPAPSESATGSKVAQLALAGYCPVTLVCRRRLEPGDASFTIQHQGREYRFASLASLEAFRKNPEAYSPANAGQCPVRSAQTGRNIPGDPHFGVVYAGRLHLCADPEARKLFIKDPHHYASAQPRAMAHPDLAEAEFCPHCRAESGQLVRGVPRYSTTYAGKRYLFPDETHLAAFEADPDKYLR